MSPLSGILSTRPVTPPTPQVTGSAEARVRAPIRYDAPASAGPAVAPRASSLSPQALIRQAEMLLQIVATNASSPALRQVAAAAYQMEIDARREITAAGAEAGGARREWFA